MAKLLHLLVLQVILFSNSAISRHVRSSNFDFDHFAHTLDEHEIFRPSHFEDEERMPHLNLQKFFDRLNDLVDAQLAIKKSFETNEDSEYYPWKKEDVEKITSLAMNDEESGNIPELLEQFMNVNGKAFTLAGKKEEEEEGCPVGTIFTYYWARKLKECFKLNIVKIVFKLMKYKLTSPLENPPEFPTETSNLIEAVATPVLNQPAALVVVNSLINGFKAFNIKKPFTLTWPFLWLGNALRNKQLSVQYLAPGNVPDLSTYDGYATFFKEYRDKQKENLFGIFPTKNFINYPLVEDPSFEDITLSNKWQSDEVFSHQRLSGLNPMSLRIFTMNDPISKYFNTDFDWEEAIRNVAGSSFDESIQSGKLFVLDYPLLHGINNMEDIEANDPLHRPMRKSISPITLFVSVPSDNQNTFKNENTLKPVAIQMDMDQDAAVFTPNDGSKWLMAKEEVQRADIVYVEIIEHLLKTHLLMEPICTIMRRAFSKLHPLYQLFHPHCKYLSVTNSVGVPALFDQNEYLHILFSIGNTGAINLLNKGYKELSWEDTNFEENLKKRGVMNINGSLPYFPYRDDGLLLWEQVGNFAKEYVDIYYKCKLQCYNPNVDISVRVRPFQAVHLSAPASIITDIELQSFAFQLNSSKIGRIAGGRFKGFPHMITSHDELIDIVKRILFIPIQHSAVNYPVSYYGAFTPNMPTKLYDPNTQDFTIESLPQYNIVSYQLSIAMTLGSIRYDRYFDYSDTLVDDQAKELVKKYYDELNGVVNKNIMERNFERHLKGKPIYPYLMPQWLTNSIQT